MKLRPKPIIVVLTILILILASSTTFLFFETGQGNKTTITLTHLSTATGTSTVTITVPSTVTISSFLTSITTITETNSQISQLIASNYPTTCSNQFPAGLTFNTSSVLVLGSAITAQVCVKYTYDNAFNVSNYDANFTGEMLIYQELDGFSELTYVPDLSQIVAFPQQVIFNATGETANVTYTMTLSNMIYEYFRPDYYCSYSGLAIPISSINGNLTSLQPSPCGPVTPFQSVQVVG